MSFVTFADVAKQIYNATRIISDANKMKLGEPVHVDIISGLSPQVTVLSSLGGTVTGPQGGSLSGPLSALLNTTVTKVNFKVKYSVKVNGNPAVTMRTL